MAEISPDDRLWVNITFIYGRCAMGVVNVDKIFFFSKVVHKYALQSIFIKFDVIVQFLQRKIVLLCMGGVRWEWSMLIFIKFDVIVQFLQPKIVSVCMGGVRWAWSILSIL